MKRFALGLAYRVWNTTRPALPLSAYRNHSFKLFGVDTGLLAAQAKSLAVYRAAHSPALSIRTSLAPHLFSGGLLDLPLPAIGAWRRYVAPWNAWNPAESGAVELTSDWFETIVRPTGLDAIVPRGKSPGETPFFPRSCGGPRHAQGGVEGPSHL